MQRRGPAVRRREGGGRLLLRQRLVMVAMGVVVVVVVRVVRVVVMLLRGIHGGRDCNIDFGRLDMLVRRGLAEAGQGVVKVTTSVTRSL